MSFLLRRIFFNILIITLFFHVVYSHENENLNDSTAYNSYDVINPLKHFQNGDFFSGVLIIIFWIALFHGIYTLLIMTLGLYLIKKKK